MHVTDVVIIRKPRKPHECYWCGEKIEGEHAKWACFSDGQSVEIRCHSECREAWKLARREDDYYADQVQPGEHSRGCQCPAGDCTCKKGGGRLVPHATSEVTQSTEVINRRLRAVEYVERYKIQPFFSADDGVWYACSTGSQYFSDDAWEEVVVKLGQHLDQQGASETPSEQP
jgi:hypothetical protein